MGAAAAAVLLRRAIRRAFHAVYNLPVLLVLLIQLRTLLLPQCRTRGVAPSERCRIAIGAIAEWSTLGTAARLLLLVAPPIFFEEVFLPCFECCPCPGP